MRESRKIVLVVIPSRLGPSPRRRRQRLERAVAKTRQASGGFDKLAVRKLIDPASDGLPA